MTLNHRLLLTLGASWTTFLITGLLINWVFAIPSITILLDRSYCPASQWQQVSANYQDLYRQHQKRQIRLNSIIVFSSLGQETLDSPPEPKTIQTLQTYGESDLSRQQKLQSIYPKHLLLSCHP